MCGISPVEVVDKVSFCLFVFVDEVGDFGVNDSCVYADLDSDSCGEEYSLRVGDVPHITGVLSRYC